MLFFANVQSTIGQLWANPRFLGAPPSLFPARQLRSKSTGSATSSRRNQQGKKSSGNSGVNDSKYRPDCLCAQQPANVDDRAAWNTQR